MEVDIGDPGIELVPIPNQTYIGKGCQYQSGCLDVDRIASWKQMQCQIQNHVWMRIAWNWQIDPSSSTLLSDSTSTGTEGALNQR